MQHYRILGTAATEPTENQFIVTLGEMRSAMDLKPDAATDHLALLVEFYDDAESGRNRYRFFNRLTAGLRHCISVMVAHIGFI